MWRQRASHDLLHRSFKMKTEFKLRPVSTAGTFHSDQEPFEEPSSFTCVSTVGTRVIILFQAHSSAPQKRPWSRHSTFQEGPATIRACPAASDVADRSNTVQHFTHPEFLKTLWVTIIILIRKQLILVICLIFPVFWQCSGNADQFPQRLLGRFLALSSFEWKTFQWKQANYWLFRITGITRLGTTSSVNCGVSCQATDAFMCKRQRRQNNFCLFTENLSAESGYVKLREYSIII